MESIVDDIIMGRCCELCGQAFKTSSCEDLPPHIYEHGGPVTCHDCYENLSTKDKQNHLRATATTFG